MAKKNASEIYGRNPVDIATGKGPGNPRSRAYTSPRLGEMGEGVKDRGKAPNSGPPPDPRPGAANRGPGGAVLHPGLMSAPLRAPQDEENAWPENEGPAPSQSSSGSPPT